MMRGAFISDYRPTKRVGIEELDGCINMFVHRLEDMAANGEAHMEVYEGALMALENVRDGTFEYPQDFMAVFDNQVKRRFD